MGPIRPHSSEEKEGGFQPLTLESRREGRLGLEDGGQPCTDPRVEVLAGTLLPPQRPAHLGRGDGGTRIGTAPQGPEAPS